MIAHFPNVVVSLVVLAVVIAVPDATVAGVVVDVAWIPFVPVFAVDFVAVADDVGCVVVVVAVDVSYAAVVAVVVVLGVAVLGVIVVITVIVDVDGVIVAVVGDVACVIFADGIISAFGVVATTVAVLEELQRRFSVPLQFSFSMLRFQDILDVYLVSLLLGDMLFHHCGNIYYFLEPHYHLGRPFYKQICLKNLWLQIDYTIY